MDALAHQIAERRVNQPLALNPALAGERRAFNAQAEMAFAGGVVPTVAAMSFAIVVKVDPGR